MCPGTLLACPLQGPEEVKQTVLAAFAEYLDCPEVATQAIAFHTVDWPSEQCGHGRGGMRAGHAPGQPAHASGTAAAASQGSSCCTRLAVDAGMPQAPPWNAASNPEFPYPLPGPLQTSEAPSRRTCRQGCGPLTAARWGSQWAVCTGGSGPRPGPGSAVAFAVLRLCIGLRQPHQRLSAL